MGARRAEENSSQHIANFDLDAAVATSGRIIPVR
jgi:hypothetical protein